MRFSLVTIGVILILLSSCQKKRTFTIQGKVKNFENGELLLINLHEEGHKDTITVKNGKFTFEGNLDEPTPYLLFAPDILPSQAFFYVHQGTVKVTFDAKDPESFKVDGGPTQKEYNEFYASTKPFLQVLDSLQNPMLQTEPDFNMEGFQQKYSEVAKNLEAISNQFILDHPKSYFSALLAYENIRSRPSISLEEKKQILASIDPSIQTSYYGSQISKLISESAQEILPIGSQAPNFNLSTPEGKAITLNNFKGKYVLLDFWASWCAPCRAENPNVVTAFNKFKSNQFAILGISLDDKKNAWLDAIKEDGLPWLHVSDLKGWNSSVVSLYGVRSIPSNFLIDPAGNIVAKNLRGTDLEQQLNAILNKK